MAETYRAFLIYEERPPIPLRDFDWCAEHEDYDGAPVEPGGPPGDDRVLYGPTREAVMAKVDRWHEEEGDG